MADYSMAQRRKLTAEGDAIDESYPIKNRADLHNAIQAIGRAKNPDAVKRYIMRRARELNALSMIPPNWHS